MTVSAPFHVPSDAEIRTAIVRADLAYRGAHERENREHYTATIAHAIADLYAPTVLELRRLERLELRIERAENAIDELAERLEKGLAP